MLLSKRKPSIAEWPPSVIGSPLCILQHGRFVLHVSSLGTKRSLSFCLLSPSVARSTAFAHFELACHPIVKLQRCKRCSAHLDAKRFGRMFEEATVLYVPEKRVSGYCEPWIILDRPKYKLCLLHHRILPMFTAVCINMPNKSITILETLPRNSPNINACCRWS